MRIRLFQKKQARLAALSGKKGKNQFFGKTTQRSYVIPMPSQGARLQPRNLSSTEEKKSERNTSLSPRPARAKGRLTSSKRPNGTTVRKKCRRSALEGKTESRRQKPREE